VPPAENGNALEAFVERSVPVDRVTLPDIEEAPWLVAGPLLLVAAGLAALVLPSAHGIEHGWLVIFAKHGLAHLAATLNSHAVELLWSALIALVIEVVMVGFGLRAEILGGITAVVGALALGAAVLTVAGILLSVLVWLAVFLLGCWLLSALAS